MGQERRVASPGSFRAAVSAFAATAWMVGFVALLPGEAPAQELDVAESVALVRALHLEGIPEERARSVGADGAARLVEMLSDPSEAPAHANILIVLGLCGRPGAFDAISAWAAIEREGEIDRDTFRAWQALPFALGHLAEVDRRAVAKLERRLDDPAPRWTFRHHRGPRLHQQGRRAAASALGMTGLPEAQDVLDRAEARETDVEFERHLRGARDANARRAAARRGERR